ncbi:nucleotidyltransferase [Thermosulfidibacter takaii ABI70S6]|uniref:Nucleotidyltransferase n=1 Tax=Thermosulfidibacter takaii (strain DSM 17441 / JCM 13301 / NBRC 103674 / ABI70S6) TaxID=1298851 RepID=A0A0S3QVA4_THET7|nr:sugar phosphate nucleotidyltransferase [Thermosulfidibacter takaii]BAT72261.1 nucleotidyltransferase [Thermosulfidibacter takaii ABI70S6]
MLKQKDIFISPKATIKEALKKLNEAAEKVLLVVNENYTLLGTLTDGDVRRYILKTGTIDGHIKDVYNSNPIFIYEHQSKEDAKRTIFKNKIEVLPVLDRNRKVVGFYRWVDFYEKDLREVVKTEKIDIPVVIMAGGKGTRLDPFTKVLPKPLLPIKDKTVTELIIDSFKKFGIRRFYLTLNYKGKVIESYFNSIEKDYEIEFLWEKEFLGTAGSLYMLRDIKDDLFFVSNCDILLNVNYVDVYKYHLKMNAVFTSITSIQNHRIPYGVVYIKEGGVIEKIEEKPEHTLQINTGVYLLNKETLRYIAPNSYLDMPQFINKLLEQNKKVIAYPINETDYIDVGQWDEYKRAMKLFEF